MRALVCAVALAGCARAVAPPDVVATPEPVLAPNAPVGYVRTDELVRRHPLSAQLTRLDEDIDALRLSAAGGEVARASAEIPRERDRLSRDLETATRRARALLVSERAEEERRERVAITAALAASGAAGGRSAAAIVASVRDAYARQAQDLAHVRAGDFRRYRNETIAQDTDAERGLARAMQERASRIVAARADRLQQAEAAEALRLAAADAGERLQIRTRLADLALGEPERAADRARLAALDRTEGDALGAMRNRDATTLAALRASAVADARAEYGRDVAALRARTANKLGRDAARTSATIAGIGPLDLGGDTSAGASLAPPLRATIERLHATFAANFARDAERTVRELAATREDLARRFTRLHVADMQAQTSARAETTRLRAQRTELAAQILAQIDRETRAVARSRGVRVVIAGTVAAPGGIDLTSAVEKEIENLHE